MGTNLTLQFLLDFLKVIVFFLISDLLLLIQKTYTLYLHIKEFHTKFLFFKIRLQKEIFCFEKNVIL